MSRAIVVSIRLDDAEHAQLRRTAERQGQTVSDVIREYIRRQTQLPPVEYGETLASPTLDWGTRMQQTVRWEDGLVSHSRIFNADVFP